MKRTERSGIMTKHNLSQPRLIGKFGGGWGKRKETVLGTIEKLVIIRSRTLNFRWVVDYSGENEGR